MKRNSKQTLSRKSRLDSFGRAQTIARLVVFVAAVASLGLTLYTGRNNSSWLLKTLFSAWVLSPGAALYVADRFSNRWSSTTRRTLHILMLTLSPLAVAGYTGIFSPAGTKPAFVFLIIPLLSWLIMAIVLSIVTLFQREL